VRLLNEGKKANNPVYLVTTVYMEMHLHRIFKYSACAFVKRVLKKQFKKELLISTQAFVSAAERNKMLTSTRYATFRLNKGRKNPKIVIIYPSACTLLCCWDYVLK
jgi:hypothetical protein